MMITNFALPPGQTVIKEINRGIDVPDDLSRIFQQKGGRVWGLLGDLFSSGDSGVLRGLFNTMLHICRAVSRLPWALIPVLLQLRLMT